MMLKNKHSSLVAYYGLHFSEDDAASNSFHSATGSRLDSNYFSTTTRFSNGEVLIVGGYARPGSSAVNRLPLLAVGFSMTGGAPLNPGVGLSGVVQPER